MKKIAALMLALVIAIAAIVIAALAWLIRKGMMSS